MITPQTSKSSLLNKYWQSLFAKDFEDRQDRRKLLYLVIFLIFTMELILFVNDSIQLPQHLERWVVLLISVSIVTVILIGLLKKHYINLSSVLLICSFWLLITLFSFSSGGIFTNLTRGYMVLTFLAGLLGGVAFGGFVGLVSILTDLSFIFWADQIAPPIARSATSQWLINTFNIVFVIFLQAHFIKNLKGAHRYSKQLAMQRQQAEQNLVESEERFRAVYDQTDIGVILFGKDTKISNVNEAFCKLVGYSRQEIEGNNYSLFTNESLNQQEREKSNEMAEGKRLSYTVERNYTRKDGSFVPVSVTVSLLRDSNGNVASYLCFITDLIEKKKIETELIQYKNQLEEKVSEQTADLRNALQVAEEAMKARSQFLANISHELRTPMNAVLGLTELLLHENLSSKHINRLIKIKTAASGLLTLLNDLLDFSKIDAGKLTIHEIQFNISDLIQTIIHFLAPEALQKKLKLIYHISESVPAIIVGDPIRIRQVLINLIHNAIKFTEAGSIECQVSITDKNPAQIRFSVTDTGIGVPKHARHQLFEPFKQVDSSMTRQAGGTGLGLAICKQLVQQMNGSIGIDDSYNYGSRFYFYLPLITTDPIDQKIIPWSKRAIPLYTKLTGRVLVVEDNDINLEVTSELLKRFGLNVEAAHDGKEAVRSALSTQYDLILMDIQMPNMDGYEATRQIREKNPSIPIVALTAHALVSEEQRSIEAGINDHLSKPIDSNILYQTVAYWLSNHNLTNNTIRIHGFDAETAIQRLDNSTELYKRLLKFFIRDHAKDGFLIKDAIGAKDIDRSRYLIHSLKGAASNILATEILTILNNLSLALKDDINFAIDLSESLINAINNATTSIQEFFDNIDFQKDIDSRQILLKYNDSADETAQLLLLDELLSRQTFDARRQIKLFKELLDKESVNLSQEIIDSVNQFNYIKARELLAPYLEKKS